MRLTSTRHRSIVLLATVGLLATTAMIPVAAAAGPPQKSGPSPAFSNAVAFDVSPALTDIGSWAPRRSVPSDPDQEPVDIRPDRGRTGADRGHSPDGARQAAAPATAQTIGAPLANFEGLSNQDNFNLFGFRVNPPDPVGDVGPNHYVEMVNLAVAVYDKSGNLLVGPLAIGSVWAGFPVEDCTDPSGDPIVLYDQLADRWILSQFTTRGLPYYYDCVAISQTSDPTGAYYRYAFPTQEDGVGSGLYSFPDYPKYSVWKDSYVLTTRDFGDAGSYGVSVYALEKNKMVNGQPNARAVQFYISGDDPALLPLIGDGLLPADIDGKTKPKNATPIPIIGTQDDDASYGATFDAINVWEMDVQWNARPDASLEFAAQLPVAPFDSMFPCAPTSRDCLPQPGITNPTQYLDILSYRQRPTYRFAWRNFGDYDSMIASQSVEAAPGVAGMRWYELRRVGGTYSVSQQGTYAPGDGVHRWMGSAAQDWQGNIALGYSVVNGVDVFPGIRYTGRLRDDPLGQMTLGEGTIIDGTGVQRTTNSRWGDYTSLNVDPTDDCTFWYVNEYYTLDGQLSSTAGWQTRIASFKLPGCFAKS